MGKFGDLDSGLNEIPMSMPSNEVDFCQDEDVLPWLDYPSIDGSLQQEYGSDFLPTSNSFTLLDKKVMAIWHLGILRKLMKNNGMFSRVLQLDRLRLPDLKLVAPVSYSLHHCISVKHFCFF